MPLVAFLPNIGLMHLTFHVPCQALIPLHRLIKLERKTPWLRDSAMIDLLNKHNKLPNLLCK